MGEEILRRTWSVCPTCLRRIRAERVRIGREVYLRKACPEHGEFRSLVWGGRSDIDEWIGGAEGEAFEDPPCPGGCGLCAEHLSGTCCVLIEVTRRCDLSCRFCFADGGSPGAGPDPTLAEIIERIGRLAVPGETLLQLSGGEPGMRDDLPEIVAAAKAAGCRYVQLNSNGLRLAEDPAFAGELAAAGLSFVFMQFDGTRDAIYECLRGRPLLAEKERAIENCAAANLGVTLVPTLVPGVNVDDIGGIIRFGVARSPAVRGVHFQPASYFGRFPAPPSDDGRLTLDELVYEIEAQSGGLVKAGDLLPSRCDHPLCGFHGDFVVSPEGLEALSRRGGTDADSRRCCRGESPADLNRRFVARRWQRPPPGAAGAAATTGDLRDMRYFLRRVETHGFTLTAMAFQDRWNIDFERLRRCSLHVFDGGRLVPFCAYYLSGREP